MKKPTFEDALLAAYKEAYAKATPSADFDELVENATINERGEKVIDFMKYEITDALADEILENISKEYKLSKPMRRKLRINYYLGCSPKTLYV
jgi:hypothetical protein